MPTDSSDIVVFSVRSRDSRCSECNEEIGRRGLLRKEGDRGLCMDCAELGDLVFLPRGNTALTRRATKYSPMRAVVVLWSPARRRYERQGILVAEEAIERAESECLKDEEIRERKRVRNAEHREVLDKKYVASFAAKIRERYPSAPAGDEDAIARHACRKYSGRVGRSAAAKELDPEMIDLAVNAWIRHRHTNYDELLMKGQDRHDARSAVRDPVDDLRERWRTK